MVGEKSNGNASTESRYFFLADPLFVRIGRKNEELSAILLSLFGYLIIQSDPGEEFFPRAFFFFNVLLKSFCLFARGGLEVVRRRVISR